MLVSIVVPCYNEEKMLPLFYKELCIVVEALSGYEFEIIFIDDGSEDSTLIEIYSLAEEDNRVRYASLSRNFGKESAIYAGLSLARGDLVTIMDADLQDPPALLPEMLKYIEIGYDSVATRRVSRKGNRFLEVF